MSNTEELIRRAQAGDRDASEALVTENSGLIWSVARRFMVAERKPMICISLGVWVF